MAQTARMSDEGARSLAVFSDDPDIRDREIEEYFEHSLLAEYKNTNPSWSYEHVWKALRSFALEYYDLNYVESVLSVDVSGLDVVQNNLIYYQKELEFISIVIGALSQARLCTSAHVFWLISQLLTVKARPELDRQLGNKIDAALVVFVQLLNPQDQSRLIRNLVSTLCDLYNGSSSNLPESPYPSTVPMLCDLLEETTVTAKDLPALSLQPCKIPIANERDNAELQQTLAKALCIPALPLCPILLGPDLVRLWCWTIVQLEKGSLRAKAVAGACDVKANRNFAPCFAAIDAYLAECSKQLAVSDEQSRSAFDQLPMSTFVEWIQECLELLDEHPSNDHVCKPVLAFLCNDVLTAVVSLIVPGECPNLFKSSALNVLHFLARDPGDGPGGLRSLSDHQLRSICRFLLVVDANDESTSDITDGLRKIFDRFEGDMLNKDKFVTSVAAYRNLIVALSSSTDGCADHVLLPLFPSPNALLAAVDIIIHLARSDTNHSAAIDCVDELLQLCGSLSSAADCRGLWPVLLSILSIPWIAHYPPVIRGSGSRSLDKPMVKTKALAALLKDKCSTDMKIMTLSSIAQVKLCNEWRKQIIKNACTCEPVKVTLVAIAQVPRLATTLDTLDEAFSLLDMIKALYSGGKCAEIDEAVVRCFGWTFVRLYELREGERYCLPSGLINFLTEVGGSVSYSAKDHQLRNVICDAVSSVLRCTDCISNAQVASAVAKLKTTLLRFLSEPDEHCREFAASILADVVSSDVSTDVEFQVQGIMFKLNNRNQTDVEWLARYLRIVIEKCSGEKNADLCDSAFIKLVLIATTQPEALRDAKECVSMLCERRGYSVSNLFAHWANDICWRLVPDINVDIAEQVEQIPNGDYETVVRRYLDDRFTALAELFQFENMIALLRAIVSFGHLLGWLVSCRTEETGLVLDWLADRLHQSRRALFYSSNCHWILLKLLQRERTENTLEDMIAFIDQQCDGGGSESFVQFLVQNYADCLGTLMTHLWKNGERYMEVVRSLYRLRQGESDGDDAQLDPPSLSECVGKNFLGVLLRFNVSGDHSMKERRVMMNSLCDFIANIDQRLIVEARQKLLLVLRSASSLVQSRDIARAWTTFVEALPDENVAGILSHILVSLQPFMRDGSVDKLLRSIFLNRMDQLRQAFDKVDNRALNDICTVFAEAPGYERLSQFLPETPFSNTQDSSSTNNVEHMMAACLRMISGTHAETKEIALLKLYKVLKERADDVRSITVANGDKLNSTVANLIPALVDCVRTGEQENRTSRLLSSKCLGELGAIDPGRLGLELSAPSRPGQCPVDRRAANMHFPDDGLPFLLELINRAANALCFAADSGTYDSCSLGIQQLLKTIAKREQGLLDKVWECLDQDTKLILTPMRTSTYKMDRSPFSDNGLPRPLYGRVPFQEWLIAWAHDCSTQVKSAEMNGLFKPCMLVVLHDQGFARYVLPFIVLQLILENDPIVVGQIHDELVTVLRGCADVGGCTAPYGGVRMSAQVAFCVLDCLHQWAAKRKDLSDPTNRGTNVNRAMLTEHIALVDSFLHRICTVPSIDGDLPLVVMAAELCQSMARALRWYEQYAMVGLAPNAQHNCMHVLERFYSELDETDGVVGALSLIKKWRQPTAAESVLAFEATGDYTGALPFYQSNGVADDGAGLLHCLLHLNQPRLVLSSVEAALQTTHQSLPAAISQEKLRSFQVEATCQLQKWDRLDQLLKSTPDTGMFSWGARIAELMSCVKHKDNDSLQSKLELARITLVDPLSATAMDANGAYPHAYKFVCRLHILSEIEDAVDRLNLQSSSKTGSLDKFGVSVAVKSTVECWNARSKLMVQSTRTLEPLLVVRRQLLSFVAEEQASKIVRNQIDKLFLQSATIARHAGHLQTAWGYIVEAKNLAGATMDIYVEEAKYHWKKGDQNEAISVLTNGLSSIYPKLAEMCSGSASQKVTEEQVKGGIMGNTNEQLYSFVTARILLAEYQQEAGQSDADSLYRAYRKMTMVYRTELLMYKLATFADQYIYCRLTDPDNRESRLLPLMQAYLMTLRMGRTYLHHAMPRMLTLWLDFAQDKFNAYSSEVLSASTQPSDEPSQENSPNTSGTEEVRMKRVVELSKSVMDHFDNLIPQSYFYSAFTQLLSRITHPVADVFKVLKHILRCLLLGYPQQCLWLSLGVFRAAEDARKMFAKTRLTLVYQEAIANNAQIGTLLGHMVCLAAMLEKVAENPLYGDGKGSPLSRASIAQSFPFLSNYLDTNEIPRDIFKDEFRENEPCRLRKCDRPAILLPLQAMLDVAVTACPSGASDSLTQTIMLSASSSQPTPDRSDIMASIPEVTIAGVDDEILPAAVNRVTSLLGLVWCPLTGTESVSTVSSRDTEPFLLHVMHSKERPKRLKLRGSDGNYYHVMCKPKDEMHLDQRLMEFNRVVNAVLRQDAESRRRQLFVRTYSVVPLSTKGGGLVEWVNNLTPYRRALVPLIIEKTGRPPQQDFRDHYNRLKMEVNAEERKKLQIKTFRELVLVHPPVMAEWFRRTFTDPCGWYAARLAFTHTTAVMSMVGFVLGLGDRHGENILIDQTCGDVFHVDFNLLFNKGENLQFPERVPFRLTHNMVNGFGPLGVEGSFRRSCEASLRVLRHNRLMLLTVMQTFLHDPLVEWIKQRRKMDSAAAADAASKASHKRGSGRAQTRSSIKFVSKFQKSGRGFAEEDRGVINLVSGDGSADGNRTVDEAPGATSTIAEQHLKMIEHRLQGHIKTPKFHNIHNDYMLPMSVEGQVDQLITLATDDEFLGQMFLGWAPFL